jgi:hypothetical protein
MNPTLYCYKSSNPGKKKMLLPLALEDNNIKLLQQSFPRIRVQLLLTVFKLKHQ